MIDYLTESEDLAALKLAGKAVGLRIPMYFEAQPEDGFPMPFAKLGKREYWNPYCDDGDAFRGAVARQLTVCNEQLTAGAVCCTGADGRKYPAVYVEGNGELSQADYAAARKAIVLALAVIGAAIRPAEASAVIDEPGRKEFEAVCLELAVKHYGYKSGEALLKTVLERRTNGTYAVEWVGGAWVGYQAALEAVAVVSIAEPDIERMLERAQSKAEDKVKP